MGITPEPDNWVRHGECDSCGFCCEAIATVDLHFDNLLDDPKFLEVRGISPQGYKTLHIYDPCSKLDLTTKLCTIYENRPKTCVDFPQTPEHLMGDVPCTYWFENTTTGEIVAGTRAVIE